MREKLIEFLNDARMNAFWHRAKDPIVYIADMLISKGVTIQKWIPVTERLPNNCKEYVCLCNIDWYTGYSFPMVLRYYLIDEKPHFQHESEHGLNVTHWMPLPEPPEIDK